MRNRALNCRARTIYSKARMVAGGSQLAPDFLALDKLVVVKKQNVATDTAALILPAVGSNYERHPKLQRFMLANDSTTIAVEVPVWLAQDDIVALEEEYGIRLHPQTLKVRSPGTLIFCKSETAPCTSSTTSPMLGPTSRSLNLPSTHSHFPALPASRCSISNAPGSTKANTANVFRARFLPEENATGHQRSPHPLFFPPTGRPAPPTQARSYVRRSSPTTRFTACRPAIQGGASQGDRTIEPAR